MKKKNKKILIGTLATLLIVGGTATVIGVASNGFKNWDTSTWFQDEFKDVKIESMTVGHDGVKKELTIVVPKEATYTTVIKKGGEIVTECIEIGTYDYEVTVKIGDKTKVYKAQLNIVENSQVSINGISNIKKQKVDESTYKLTATITPDNATKKDLIWTVEFKNPNSSWASGKKINDYVNLTSDQNTATIKMLKRFGEQILIKATATDYTKVSATCTVDCKKIITDSSCIYKGDPDISFMEPFTGEYGEGFVFDIGKMTDSAISAGVQDQLFLTDIFDKKIMLSEGTIENLEKDNFTFELNVEDGNMQTEFYQLLGTIFSADTGNDFISFVGDGVDGYPGLLDDVDNYLAQIGESSLTGYYGDVYVNMPNKKTKKFAFYVKNTVHMVGNINLSENNIVFN